MATMQYALVLAGIFLPFPIYPKHTGVHRNQLSGCTVASRSSLLHNIMDAGGFLFVDNMRLASHCCMDKPSKKHKLCYRKCVIIDIISMAIHRVQGHLIEQQIS